MSPGRAEVAVADLKRSGLTREVHDAEAACRRQEATLSRLLARHPRDATQTYTTVYDSMMRIAEIATLGHGVEFGDQPHRALKNLAISLDAGFRIDEIVKVRHRVKKTHASPSPEETEELLKARDHLADLLGLAHLLG